MGADAVRKGLPQLLAAWEKSGVDGELVINTHITASLNQVLGRRLNSPHVRLVNYTTDAGSQFKSADVFVLPTLEEGDPLVTYEAAGCGLPVITTPMGSANIIRHGINGLIVRPYDIEGLADTISRLACSTELRTQLGLQAALDAQNYTYEKVGRQRANMLRHLLAERTVRGSSK